MCAKEHAQSLDSSHKACGGRYPKKRILLDSSALKAMMTAK